MTDPSDASSGDRAEQHLDRIEQLSQKQLGDMLVEAGLVEPAQLQKAQAIREQQGGDTVKTLIALGYLEVDDFLDFLGRQPNFHKFDLSRYEVPLSIVRLVPHAYAVEHEVFPIDCEGDELLLAVARPLDDAARSELETQTRLTVRPVLCSGVDIRAAIGRYYVDPKVQERITASDPAVAAAALSELETPLRLTLIARLVRDIDEFPALPETVERTREAMMDPTSSVVDVARIIMMDPPIAARVLSVANSAAYGFPRQIEDLQLAVTLLGLRETYSIVLSAAVLNLIEKCKHFDYRRFWVDAMCCAAATRFVVKAAGLRNLTGVFAAGLLHDIGRVALSEVAPGLYARVDTTLSGRDLVADEIRRVGLSHTEAGYELAMHWGLPDEIAVPVRFHLAPGDAPRARKESAIVSLANQMAHAQGAGLADNEGVFDGYDDALGILALDPEVAEAMLDDFLHMRDDSLREELL